MIKQLVESPPITEEDLLRMGAKEERAEVVNGEIISMTPVGVLHVIVAGNVLRILDAYVRKHKLGYVFMDSLIYILKHSEAGGILKTRIPDTSFVRRGRILPDFDLRRPFPGAPDLAVEVISPGDSAKDLLAKIRDYFQAGAEQAWVLYPDQKELHQYIREADSVRVYSGADRLEADTLFPGIKLPVEDFFALPDLED